MEHLLLLEDLTKEELENLVTLGGELKATRGNDPKPLDGQCWALIFCKSSTRTRVSFEVGIRELGGHVMFLSDRAIQLGRGEPIEDTARVLGRMVHGAIIRTFSQEEVKDFAHHSKIPTINALTDAEHPCQVLADLLTIREKLGGWEGKKIAFLGDGACNMGISWVWAAERLGFELAIASPKGFQPAEDVMARTQSDKILITDDPKEAADGADVLYTDVWVSMGKEAEKQERIALMQDYQINQSTLDIANPEAIVMHCLPAYRGLEITADVLEAHADTIFQQAENRLHAQKAIMTRLAEAHA